jgi:hypothetical protein
MKKFIFTILFAAVTAFSISSCQEQNIKPKDGEGSGSSDPCQFGGPGCPKTIQ